jgi:peptide/nickel transport system substrate-binding protein
MSKAGEIQVAVRTNHHFFNSVYDDLPQIVYEPLLRYRPRRRGYAWLQASLADLEPRLLAGWEASSGLDRYLLHLRPGVRSALGNELTAEDVKWSWDRAFLLRRQGRFTCRIAPVRSESDVVVLDRTTLEFRLERPNLGFPHFLTSKYVPIVDATEVRRHVTADDPYGANWLESHSAGFGAFSVSSFDRAADVATYVANPHYWDRNPAQIQRLVLRGVADPDQRAAMLRRGEVDAATSLTAELYKDLAGQPGLEGYRLPGHDPLLLQMNCQREPFKQREVRRALSFAVPYARILEEAWGGMMRPLRSPLIDVCMGYTDAGFPYVHDPSRAREMLAAAGLGSGFSAIMMIYSGLTPHIGRTATLLQDALAEVGVRVTIRDVDEGTLRTAGFAHDFDLLLDPHIHMVPDGYYIAVCDYGDSKWGIENINQYFGDEAIRRQKECLEARTEDERIATLHAFQHAVVEDAPQAFLAMLDTLMVARADLRGLAWEANGRLLWHLARTA